MPADILAVRYGTWESTRAETFYRYHAYGEPDGPIRLDYFFWLLRGGGQTILVDTGFDPAAGERRGRTCLVEPKAALARLGVAPEQVSRVVVSHLHYDHIGNLAAFPEAAITVQRRELEFWTGPYGRRPQFAGSSEPNEIAYLEQAAGEGRVQLLDGDGEIAPGVVAMLVGGHCPGQQIVICETPAGRVVLASDALHFYEEMERDMPFAVLSSLPDTYRAYDLLRELEGEGARLVAGHDPLVTERFPGAGGPASDLAVRLA
ncbi:MAG: N-acyl homoserine lactonase family protein [Acidimicrobiales bacterium]|nr:N-acyl homoserine lactonase family protein [Acidimicrobiales bacterium]